MLKDIRVALGLLYKKYIDSVFKRQHIALLEQAVIGSCKTVLDIGCGDGHHMTNIARHLTYSVGIDVYEESLSKANDKGIYTQTQLMDVRDINRLFPEVLKE